MLRRLHPAPLLLAALVLLLLPPSTPTTSSSSSSPILAPSLSQKTSPASSSSSLSEEPPQEEDEDKEWTWHLLSFLDADPYVDRSLFDYILDWRAPSAANPANVARTLTGFQWPERARTSERQVRLLFLGDLTPHKQFGADLSVSRRLRRELGDADLVVINLEACVRSEPSSNAGKRLIFEYETDKLKKLLLRLVSHSDSEEAPPEDVQRTRLSRVVLNIANNHAYDSSTSAPSVTVKELQQMGVQVVGDAVEGKGADTSVDPKSIIKVVDVDGGRLKVGIVGWTELLNSPSRFFKRSVGLNRVSQLTATVKKGVSIDVNIRTERTIELLERADIPGMRASGEVDFVVASPHWDYENNFFPHHKTVAYAERLFKAGVQLIVGHGPHVVQPIGVADANGHVAAPGPITPPLREAQGLVAYSVGNFIPSGQSSGATACGMMLEVNVFPRVSASESSEGHDAAFASYEAHSVMFAGDRIEVDSTPRDSNHPARSWGPDMTTMYKKCSNVFELTFSEQRRSHEIANASLTGVDVTKLWAEYDKCRATTVMKPERTLEVTFGLIENVIEMFGRNAARKMLSKVRPFILSDYSLARAKYKIEKPYAKVAAQDAKEALALLLCGEDNRFCTSLDIYGGIYMRALSDGALMTWRSLTLALKRGQLPSFVRLVHRYGLLAEYSVADWVFSLSKCVGVLQNKIEPMVAELQKQITALHALFVESEDNFFKSRAMLEKNAESGNKQAQDEIARADETHRRHMAQIRATLEIAYAAQNTLQSALGKQLRARAERIAEMERARIEKEEKKTSGLFSSVGKFVSNIFGRLKRGDRVTSKGATSRDKEGRLARA